MPGFCVGTGSGKLKHACNRQGNGDNICWMQHPVTDHKNMDNIVALSFNVLPILNCREDSCLELDCTLINKLY